MQLKFIGLLLSIVVLIVPVMKGANANTASLVAALVAGLTNGFGIWQIKKFRAKGIGFDPNPTLNMNSSDVKREDCPSVWKAFLPLVLLVALYLALYNGTFGIQKGSFIAVSSAMFVATVAVLVLNPGKFTENMAAIKQATENWTTPLFNFTCMIAFGAVHISWHRLSCQEKGPWTPITAVSTVPVSHSSTFSLT